MRSLFLCFICLSFLFILISCNRKVIIGLEKKDYLVFPPSPDTARIQYLTKFSGSQDILKPQSKIKEYVFGKRSEVSIIKPYGIFVKGKRIYVTDTGIPGLNIIDLENKDYSIFKPEGRGKLITPVNCYIDEHDFLYVADATRKQIVIFNEKHDYVTSIGDTGTFKPTDVVVDKERIYVPNSKNHKIQVFSTDSLHNQLFTFPSSEYGNDDYLYMPTNIYINGDKIYVSDFGHFKVKIFDLEGNYISSVGEQGKNIGQFARIKGIAVDNDDNLYVVDASFNNVQIFDKLGRVLLVFGGAFMGTSGFLYLPANVTIDYDNLEYFQQFVDPKFDLKYLIFVTNQYGPDKVTVYGRVELKK